MTKIVLDAQKFGCPFIPCGKAKIIELFLQSSDHTSFHWWTRTTFIRTPFEMAGRDRQPVYILVSMAEGEALP